MSDKAFMEHFKRGLELHRRGELAGAKREYMEAIRLNPSFSEAHFNIGVILHAEGDLDGAISWFERGLSHDPQNALAHANLGKLYEEKGLWERALEEGERAASLDPKLIPDVERRRERIRRKISLSASASPLNGEGWIVRDVKLLLKGPFRVEMPGDSSDEEMRWLIHVLEEAYREMGEKLECFPDRVVVTVYRSREEMEREGFKLPDRSLGCFTGERIALLIPRGREYRVTIRDNLRHEYAHLLIHEITSGECPEWLNEGLAEFLARELYGYEREMISRARESGDLSSLDEYLRSYAKVEELVKRLGMKGIRETLGEPS